MEQEIKTASAILYEYGINIMEYNDSFNSSLLKAMEEYKNQFASHIPPGKEKPFITANVRDIVQQYYVPNGEQAVSFSSMVELLNEVAFKWHNQFVSTPPEQKEQENELKVLLNLCDHEGKPYDGFRFRETILNIRKILQNK